MAEQTSKRIERDGVLVQAEGDIITATDDDVVVLPVSKKRVERDGVLVYAEGDEIPATDVEELRRQGYASGGGKAATPAGNKAVTAPANKSATK